MIVLLIPNLKLFAISFAIHLLFNKIANEDGEEMKSEEKPSTPDSPSSLSLSSVNVGSFDHTSHFSLEDCLD